MRDMNRVTLLGRLGADPVLRITKAGTHVTRLSMATTEQFRPSGAEPDSTPQERTTWHKVVVWGKQAKNCAQYLRKGRPILVDGSLRTHSYVDDKEVKRLSVEIHADTVSFVGDAPRENIPAAAVEPTTAEQTIEFSGALGIAMDNPAETNPAELMAS